MAESNLLLLVAGIIGIGVLAQILADRLQVPAIIFYIAVGLTIGEPGLDLVTQETFGTALPTVVGFAVAIIVFEGAFHLKIERIKEAPAAAIRLVTIGAIIALVGTAAAVRYALGVPWDLSLVIGSLLVATGPTVVTPILKVVPVRDRVAAALETEGIVNDVTAAILAIVFFNRITSDVGLADLQQAFVTRVGIGLLFGVIVSGVVYYLLRYIDLSPGDAPRNARLLVLAGALVAFAAANFEATEAGVAAAATAGFLLGNADIPYEHQIESFKGDLTLLVLSFVFIALAALVRIETLQIVGWRGVLVVALIALVVRPALMFLSTLGDRFTTNEKLFMSFVGPRGIIPASVATLFAVELTDEAASLRTEASEVAGTEAVCASPELSGEAATLCATAATLDQHSQILLGTVFLAILLTAVFEGGLARYIAEYLDVIPMRVIIVGGGKVGRSLAERLEDRGENVVIVEERDSVVQQARNEGYTVHNGDGTDTDALRSAGAENAKIVAAATGDDDANLLVAQLASAKFDVDRIIARANNPDNVDAFEDLGVNTISASMATAWAMDNQIERPAISHWMTDVGRDGDVQEVAVTNEELFGLPISEVGPMLPDACLIPLVTREGKTEVPTADFVVERGDKLTLLGRHDSVREGMAFVNPQDGEAR